MICVFNTYGRSLVCQYFVTVCFLPWKFFRTWDFLSPYHKKIFFFFKENNQLQAGNAPEADINSLHNTGVLKLHKYTMH